MLNQVSSILGVSVQSFCLIGSGRRREDWAHTDVWVVQHSGGVVPGVRLRQQVLFNGVLKAGEEADVKDVRRTLSEEL